MDDGGGVSLQSKAVSPPRSGEGAGLGEGGRRHAWCWPHAGTTPAPHQDKKPL